MNKQMLRKDFMRCAVPGIFALLLNSVYIVVDGLFVARLIGADALAAVTVAVPVMEVLIALSLLISVGAGALISRLRGRGDEAGARELFNQSFWLMGIVAVVIALVGVALHKVMGAWLGGTIELLGMVSEYLLLLFAFAPFFMYSYGLGAWARNDDQPNLALLAMAVGAATNIALDYVFIEFCGWGVAGAAFATGLGPVVSCAILLPHFLRGKGALRFERVRLRLSAAKEILFSGIPSFMMEFALGLTTLVVNLAVSAHMGALGLAAYGIVGYVALICLTMFLGMAEGTQPLLSYQRGRGDGAALGYLFGLSVGASVALGVALYGVVYALRFAVAGFFGAGNEALVTLGAQALALYFTTLFASGVNIQCSSCLQSVGLWGRSAMVSALRSLVWPALLLWLLPGVLGQSGVWLAVPLGELLTAAISLPICLYSLRSLNYATKERETRQVTALG